LLGNSVDLTTELESIALNDGYSGSDSIDIAIYGIVATGAVLTGDTMRSSTSGILTDSIKDTNVDGTSAFVRIDAAHHPLAEDRVQNAPDSLRGTAMSSAVDVYGPNVDDLPINDGHYANNPGVDNVFLVPFPSWLSSSFNSTPALTSVIVQSTTDTFISINGKFEASADNLAPDPRTVVDLTDSQSDNFAAAFDKGGAQATEFNTDINPARQGGWRRKFDSVSLTYDSGGQLVEASLYGGSDNPLFTVHDVSAPSFADLWEQVQSTTPPPEALGKIAHAMTNDPCQCGLNSATKPSVQFESVQTQARRRTGRSDGRRRRELIDHFLRIQQHLLESPNTLEDREILEMILHIALAGRDTRPLARTLLQKYRTFGSTIASPSLELSAMRGLGKKGVAALKLIQASAVNVLRKEVATAPVVSCWDQLIDYLSVSLMHERVEHFHVLFLDSRGAVIANEAQGLGTIDRVPVFPREIVRRCLELHATSLIIVHNHPSGDPAPSREDIAITQDVERAAAIMGIALHDHIIVGRFGYRSFRQENLLC
jgi:DNA repair protein RadC